VHVAKERHKLQATMGLALTGGGKLAGSAVVEHALQVGGSVGVCV
jgi:hypothetical protein